MQCPYCNKEMHNGIIQADGRHSVNWFPDDEEGGAKKVRLAISFLGMNELEAFYCDSCQKMIIDTKDIKQPKSFSAFWKELRGK